ncbi:MAG: hypothetical protein LBG43_04755 [Treponema sp.]|nr:hypothetical protein [Treponema sp.]
MAGWTLRRLVSAVAGAAMRFTPADFGALSSSFDGATWTITGLVIVFAVMTAGVSICMALI